MGKLLNFFDKYALKFCVIFLIFFVPLYPKLPSIHITHTWVYIRLEDFVIAAAAIIWLIQLIRRRVKVPWEVGTAIVVYWIAGFFSLVLSLIFVGPHLLNFFPSIAALSYLRRIEYMILFFIAFSSVRSIKDVRQYTYAIFATIGLFTIYGFGQKFYIYIWNSFPSFFSKHPFCFPSFQTGNEEFAKGIPLCLPFDGRITSTFAGHYDLAAYLVLTIPILIATMLLLKNRIYKTLFALFTLLTIILLILTASRIAFPAYLVGSSIALVLLGRKRFIVPLVIISIILLPLFSGSTFRRFTQTFRVANIVVDSSGNVVGEELSAELRAKLAKDKGVLANIPTQNLPAGTGYIGLPQSGKEKTGVAVVRSKLTPEQARRLKLENGGVELSTVKGKFTLKRALVYDISLTTRFQAEWPNAIRAFSRNVVFGSGFSTITLATDNDFLRFLGETGIAGLISFLFIFLTLWILFKKTFRQVSDPIVKAFAAGLAGGLVGLFLNASLFDIFEASKVAETMWILIGISAAALVLSSKAKIDYKNELKKLLTSHGFIVLYLTIILITVLARATHNFFVADDFTWLRWAANFSPQDFSNSFTNATGFFYRPLDKIFMFLLYSLFTFSPAGYHVAMLASHLLSGIGVYGLSFRVSKNKLIAFASAFIFLFLPFHAENIYWISTISSNLASLFIIYGLFAYSWFREKNSIPAYIVTIPLFAISLFFYETSVVFMPLLLALDLLVYRLSITKKNLLTYIPYLVVLVIYFYLWRTSNALGLNGDYSYSIPHLIPNFVGNFVGYISGFIFGESALNFYSVTRNILRENRLFAGLIIFGLMLISLAVIFIKRQTFRERLKNKRALLFVFGLAFSFIALLPYLGLGNISERYLYLASAGLAISFSVVLDFIPDKLGKFHPRIIKEYVFVALLVILGLFYFKELLHSNYEWQTAGKITKRTLSYLKIYDEEMPHKSNLFFVNTPIKFQDAWVFPVGLSDGIWFIYSDDSLNIRNVPTLDEAKKLKSQDENNKSFIFLFKDLKVGETK